MFWNNILKTIIDFSLADSLFCAVSHIEEVLNTCSSVHTQSYQVSISIIPNNIYLEFNSLKCKEENIISQILKQNYLNDPFYTKPEIFEIWTNIKCTMII